MEYIEDRDNEFVIYANKLSNSEVKISLEGERFNWSNQLTATGELSIKHLSTKNGAVVIGGTFENILSFASNTVGSANGKAAFVLRTDLNGSFLYCR